MRCKFLLSMSISSGSGVRGHLENQECRNSHLRQFCNAIKILKLPEFSLIVDVSKKKVNIYFMLLNVFEHKLLLDRQKNTSARVLV